MATADPSFGAVDKQNKFLPMVSRPFFNCASLVNSPIERLCRGHGSFRGRYVAA